MRQLSKFTHFFFSMLFISLPISKGATSVVVVVLMLLALFKLREGFPKIEKQDWALLSPIAIFVALAISLLYSSDLDRAFALLYRQNAFLFFPIIFYLHKDFLLPRISTYLQSFSYAMLFVALLTLTFFFLPESSTIRITQTLSFLKDYTPQHERIAFGAYSPFIDRLQFGYLLGIALLVQFWAFFQGKKRFFPAVAALILGFAFLILGARGAQIAFLLAMPIWIVWIYRQYVHLWVERKIGKFASIVIISLSTLFILLGLPYITYKNVPAFAERYNQLRWEIRVFQLDDLQSHDYVHFTSIRRIMSWNNTCKLIQQQPLAGTGLGDIEKELKVLYKQDALGFPVNSHNQFLYYWASAGLLAFLTFIYSLFLFGRTAWSANKSQYKALNLSFGIFFLIIFLFDIPLVYQVGSTSFYTFYCLFLLLAGTKKNPQFSPSTIP